MKSQQVKAEWGVRGEGERASDKWSEKWSIRQKWKWYGSEMAIRENGHLSIFSKANQKNK